MRKFLIVCAFACMFFSCNQHGGIPKIFYINSYHAGYGSSDDIYHGINETLGDKVELRTFFMDTKRNSDHEFIQTKVDSALAIIENFKPDLVIASDDNAIKYVVEPHLKNTKLPILFCGVNWSAEQYGLPTKNVTGMLEVLPLIECVKIIQEYYPHSKKLSIMSENTTSEQKNKAIFEGMLQPLGLTISYEIMANFSDWKAAFKEANRYADIIFLPTNGAIKNWDELQAKEFVLATIQKPVITCDDFMMPYCVFGLTKIAREQGEWVAETALDILNGKQSVDTIEMTENKKSKAWLNALLAQKIDFEPNQELLARCTVLNK